MLFSAELKHKEEAQPRVQKSRAVNWQDIEAAYNCLLETYGAKVEDVILYGQSVGSGPTSFVVRYDEINRRIEEVMMTMRASIRDEVLTELRGGNGPSSIDNVPTSSSIHRPDLDID
ncbi:hypothetical protein LguiA_005532 [Lonicera macranthoides]